jgi:hypothetical protein
MSQDTNDANDSDATNQTADTNANSTVVRRNWEQSDQPGVIVLEAVSAATGRAETDLPPLRDSVDPDALDTVLTGGQSPVTVSFRYADTDVVVSGNGAIEIRVDADPPAGDGE